MVVVEASVVVAGAVVVVPVDAVSVVDGGDWAPPAGTSAASSPAAASAQATRPIRTGRFKAPECNARSGEDRS